MKDFAPRAPASPADLIGTYSRAGTGAPGQLTYAFLAMLTTYGWLAKNNKLKNQ